MWAKVYNHFYSYKEITKMLFELFYDAAKEKGEDRNVRD